MACGWTPWGQEVSAVFAAPSLACHPPLFIVLVHTASILGVLGHSGYLALRVCGEPGLWKGCRGYSNWEPDRDF